MLKKRIFALLILIVSSVALYLTWYDGRHNNGYYLKAAAFAPVGVVMGIFIFIFPQFSGRPETTRDRLIVLAVFGLGLLCGLYNWYLIDPSKFDFLIK